jgi:hypothetical protein
MGPGRLRRNRLEELGAVSQRARGTVRGDYGEHSTPRTPFSEERPFGSSGPEGNHCKDVKQAYCYLDVTPAHSHRRMFYTSPQAEYPYEALVDESRRRGRAGTLLQYRKEQP